MEGLLRQRPELEICQDRAVTVRRFQGETDLRPFIVITDCAADLFRNECDLSVVYGTIIKPVRVGFDRQDVIAGLLRQLCISGRAGRARIRSPDDAVCQHIVYQILIREFGKARLISHIRRRNDHDGRLGRRRFGRRHRFTFRCIKQAAAAYQIRHLFQRQRGFDLYRRRAVLRAQIDRIGVVSVVVNDRRRSRKTAVAGAVLQNGRRIFLLLLLKDGFSRFQPDRHFAAEIRLLSTGRDKRHPHSSLGRLRISAEECVRKRPQLELRNDRAAVCPAFQDQPDHGPFVVGADGFSQRFIRIVDQVIVGVSHERIRGLFRLSDHSKRFFDGFLVFFWILRIRLAAGIGHEVIAEVIQIVDDLFRRPFGQARLIPHLRRRNDHGGRLERRRFNGL